MFVDACAHAGTGNVLKIQEMLHYCNDHLDEDEEDAEVDAEDIAEKKPEADAKK